MTLTNKAILEKQRNNAEQSVPLCTRKDETGMMETFKMVSSSTRPSQSERRRVELGKHANMAIHKEPVQNVWKL